MTREQAQRAVLAIEGDIRDRRGIQYEWSAIDDDVKEEIRSVWVECMMLAQEGSPETSRQLYGRARKLVKESPSALANSWSGRRIYCSGSS